MSRLRRTTREEMEDKFVDLPLSDQAKMLESYTLLHRQAKRLSGKSEPEQPALPGTGGEA